MQEEDFLDERHVSRRKFIRLGAALGLGSVGASVATACGGGGGYAGNEAAATAAGASGKTGGNATGAGPKVGAGQAIAQESEVAPNTAFPFTDAATGQPAVLVHLESGEFVAYSAVCTHQTCTVAYQSQAQRLACPCHGAVFDPAKGATVEVGPAPVPLPPIKVEVKGGDIVRV